MVEFALISSVALMVLVVGIQLALIGQAALAVNQLAYQGARYAAVNPTVAGGGVVTYMKSIAPTNINQGTKLNITVTPSTAPRSTASTVSVAVSYDVSGSMVLPNPFLGVRFPTQVSSTLSAMSE